MGFMDILDQYAGRPQDQPAPHFFGNSDPQQPAGLLNQVLGPLGQVLSRPGAGGQLGDLLRRLGGGFI